jgi:hypothetical protein
MTFANVTIASTFTPITRCNQGGTGNTSLTANGVLIGNGSSAVSATAAGTTGQVLVGNAGGAPSWAALTSSAVTTISFGTTGLTPNSATQGAVTVAGILGIANGGTNSSHCYGRRRGVRHWHSTRLQHRRTSRQALLSGGAGAPTFGTLGTGAGGTGLTSFTANGVALCLRAPVRLRRGAIWFLTAQIVVLGVTPTNNTGNRRLEVGDTDLL